MLLLRLEKAGRTRLVTLWGAGLIGNAIAERLQRSEAAAVQRLPFDWTATSAEQRRQWEEIRKCLNAQIKTPAAGPVEWHWIWAAGRAGFGASSLQTEAELEQFQRVLEHASERPCHHTSRHFHLVSSAGGLFEGQHHVQRSTAPKPLRPYGKLKATQETLLVAAARQDTVDIYRPSSVYGPIDRRFRMGLIPVLIDNGLNHRESVIFGSLQTLRDYVMVDDLGRFIGQRVVAVQRRELPVERHFLVTGSSNSIFEICHQVRAVIGRPIYLKYLEQVEFARGISFSRQCLPADFRPVEIRTGIRLVHSALRHQAK